jgi:hypothetical protein
LRKSLTDKAFAAWLCLSVAGGFASCTTEDPVTTSVGTAVGGGPGTRLALVEHATFNWDSVCIFGPYTSDTMIQAATGIPGATQYEHDLQSREDINLLLFIAEGRIMRSVAHPRRRGDFGPEIAGKCFTKSQAVFSVRTPPPGSSSDIGPLQQ